MVPPDVERLADLASDFCFQVRDELADEADFRSRDGHVVAVRVTDEHVVAIPWNSRHKCLN